MKNFKRVLAVMLALVMVMSIGLVGLVSSNAASATADEDEPIVARMYLGHKPRNNNTSGHTWIYIENLTNGTLRIGACDLPKGLGVSIGTYGTTVADGKGLYYNVEAWRYRNVDPSTYVHLSKDLTQAQLDKVNNKIVNSNHWSYIFNCAYTSIKIWNTIPGQTVIYLFFPPLTHWQITMNPNHGNGFPMTKPTLQQIFKQIDNQDGTVTTKVTDPSVINEEDA